MMCLSPRPTALVKPSVYVACCHGLSYVLGQPGKKVFGSLPALTSGMQHQLSAKARCCHEGCLLGAKLEGLPHLFGVAAMWLAGLGCLGGGQAKGKSFIFCCCRLA